MSFQVLQREYLKMKITHKNLELMPFLVNASPSFTARILGSVYSIEKLIIMRRILIARIAGRSG